MPLASTKGSRREQMKVTFLRNNLDMLARYNRRAVEQCYQRVYCSVKDGLVGVSVASPRSVKPTVP